MTTEVIFVGKALSNETISDISLQHIIVAVSPQTHEHVAARNEDLQFRGVVLLWMSCCPVLK